MPRSPTARPPVHTPTTASSAALWVGWSVYTLLALVGFCFGVWAGSQKPKPAEVAKAPPAPPESNKPPDKAADKPESKSAPETKVTPTPEPASPPSTEKVEVPKPPEMKAEEVKKDEPKKDPPKPEEPKKAEPKKAEPKKSDAPTANVTFAKDVMPVFRSYCFNCHGAGAGKPKGGLDLRTLAAVQKGGTNGPAVKAGDPAGSPVYSSIEDNSMPPDGLKGPSAGDKKLIRDWILGGAK